MQEQFCYCQKTLSLLFEEDDDKKPIKMNASVKNVLFTIVHTFFLPLPFNREWNLFSVALRGVFPLWSECTVAP